MRGQGLPLPAPIHPDGAAVLEAECDILIPAALEGAIKPRQRREHKGASDHRGRQRPDHGRCRRDPAPQGDRHHSRPLCQRGRRDRVLFRGGSRTSLTSASAGCSGGRRNRAISFSWTNWSGSRPIPASAGKLTPDFKQKYLKGRKGELELVRSGLDDTMRGAYQSMREIWWERDVRHRPAHGRLPRGDRNGSRRAIQEKWDLTGQIRPA